MNEFVVEHDGEQVPESEILGLRRDVIHLRETIDKRRTRSRILVALLVAAVTTALIMAGTAVKASVDSQNAIEEAKASAAALSNVVEQDRVFITQLEEARTQAALLACQSRNSSQLATRDAFALVLNLIVFADPDKPPTAETTELVERINTELAAIPDRDCNDNKTIDAGDYQP